MFHFCRLYANLNFNDAVYSVAYYTCALISLTLAQQDGLRGIAGYGPIVELYNMDDSRPGGNMSSENRDSTVITQDIHATTFHQESELHTFIKVQSSNVSGELLYNVSDEAIFDNEPIYIGPEVLVDMEPEEMVLSDSQPSGRRKPVKDGFSHDQNMELLRLHNLYRSNITPPAGNMNFMEWDEALALVAQQWANGCRFEHGFPTEHSYPKSMGQNLYMGWDPTGERALYLWYEEYKDYDLENLFCVPNKQCGHYTQMSWGDSRLVGCGMKRCGNRRFYVVCHYHPAGNIVGSAPYIVGKACSQCSTVDGGLCTNNLCVTKEQCERNPESCNAVCPLECQNCGVLDNRTCSCECSNGWDSLDCSRKCVDSHERCGLNPGWPRVAACSMNQHDVENIYCRKMCGKCRGVEHSVSDHSLCCRGAICGEGQVLDFNRNHCKCQLLCPGPKCHYESESSGLSKSTRTVAAFAFVTAIQFITLLVCL